LGTIMIVHFAANRVGFRLFYFPLFLSAALALAINLAVISMKEVRSPLNLVKILLTVLIAAALVTIVNDVQARREKKRLIALKKDRKKIADRAKTNAAQEGEETAESVSEDESLEELKEEKPKKESFFKRLFKGKKETEKPIEPEPIEKEETLENVEVEHEEEAEEANEKNIGEETSETDFDRFETLDDILDYAYDERISGHYKEAVAAYNAAIEKYYDDPYLPFLFIDLANVHKNQGEYDAAIDVYKKAANMENIKNNEETLKSFDDNINYLVKLKKVLRKKKMEHARFGDLTEDIFKEVDDDSE